MSVVVITTFVIQLTTNQLTHLEINYSRHGNSLISCYSSRCSTTIKAKTTEMPLKIRNIPHRKVAKDSQNLQDYINI